MEAKNNMTLNELKYILAVAEEKHFGRAAEKCRVSQPTLSIAVKNLEQELGVLIFERSKSSIAITPMGESILDTAKSVLGKVDSIYGIAKSGKNQLTGPARIGAIYTVGPYLFPHLIPELKKRAPDVTLYIEENFTSVLREKLKNNALDLIIVSLPFTDTDIVTKPLYDEQFEVLLPKKHKLARKKIIAPEDLLQESILLLGQGHCFRDQVLDYCPNLREKLLQNHLVEGGSLETLRHMVASGYGITILPMSAMGVNTYMDNSLAGRQFKSPAPFRTIVLAWRASFTRPKLIEILSNIICRCNLELRDETKNS